MLAVIRFDDLRGQADRRARQLRRPSGHDRRKACSSTRPITRDSSRTRSKPSWRTKCVFMQGAAGDMSPNPNPGPWEPKSFGETLADHVIALARSVKTEVPAHPSVKGMVDTFHFKTRVDLKNPLVVAMFARAFFPEITRSVRQGSTATASPPS